MGKTTKLKNYRQFKGKHLGRQINKQQNKMAWMCKNEDRITKMALNMKVKDKCSRERPKLKMGTRVFERYHRKDART
jgi:hypothetical protein